MPGEHEFAVPSSSGGTASTEKLTNEDFRKLMMTPRSSGQSSLVTGTPSLGSGTVSTTPQTPKSDKTSSAEKKDERKKKKNYYAKLKRNEDDKLAELASKYRDRAKERRDGGEGGRPDESSGAYRAVAPDVKGNFDAAERRRQMIQESKFLGGDMEHTHLVKGLDFALLQKVRSEIATREKVSVEDVETTEAPPKPNMKLEKYQDNELDLKRKDIKKDIKSEESEDQVVCRTTMAKNIIRTVFKTDMPERNELFFPGRMAYTMDLDDVEESHDDPDSTNPHSDIPTTTIRSKADVQGNLAHQQAVSLSANDIVINKLTQILSYLRAAGSRGKKKKKDKLVPQLPNPKSDPVAAAAIAKGHGAELPIFDDTGDYVPDYNKRSDKSSNNVSSRDRDRD